MTAAPTPGALRKETDQASKDRLAKLERELGNLKDASQRLRAKWESEKGLVSAIRDLRREIEEQKVEMEKAELRVLDRGTEFPKDLNGAAQLVRAERRRVGRPVARTA